MTQRQISHDFDLPLCADGHQARHMLDMRAPRVGGGDFIECQCRSTVRHGDFDQALAEWCRLNDTKKPRIPKRAELLQFRLPLQRSARP
ncbi:hypothetical protein AB4Y64_09705 [Lysobacter sp. TAF61]|uniref:hypothetical protein n=1 Tax=Lysobacter sp. TAF61 TaxID=3233072 RepID=UPI003F97F720